MKIVSLGSWTAASQLDSTEINNKENQQVTPINGADPNDPALNEQSMQSRLSLFERGLWQVFEDFKKKPKEKPLLETVSQNHTDESNVLANKPLINWAKFAKLQRGIREYLKAGKRKAFKSDKYANGYSEKVWLDIRV